MATISTDVLVQDSGQAKASLETSWTTAGPHLYVFGGRFST